MDRYRPLIACVLVTACNAVYDLRATRGPDSDGDGLSDEDDNCALVSSADQHDADGDGLGDPCDPCDGPQLGSDRDGDGLDDACDACPDGSNHDEDGDGYLDGCDLCPGDPDNGDDADGDGVGDRCDPQPDVSNHRVFFDGFAPADPGWETWFQDWTSADDAYGPVVSGGIGAWNPTAQTTSAGWWMEAVAITPSEVQGDAFGIQARVLPGGGANQDCYALFDSVAWRPNAQFQLMTTLTAITRFHLLALPDGTFQCTINGVPFDGTGKPRPADVAYMPSLISYYRTTFLWVDVVAGP